MIGPVDHVGVAVRSLREALEDYRRLGLEPDLTEDVPSQGVRVAFLRAGAVRIELLESLKADVSSEPDSSWSTRSRAGDPRVGSSRSSILDHSTASSSNSSRNLRNRPEGLSAIRLTAAEKVYPRRPGVRTQ